MGGGNWKLIATKKREQLAASIPEEYMIPEGIKPKDDILNVTTWSNSTDWFTKEEKAITCLPASELLAKIAKSEWSAEMVAKAFCKKAAAAQQLTNCLTSAFFDVAISTAKELDNYLKETGKTRGPLHGLPISLKDNFMLKGYDSCVGFTSLVNDPAEHDSTLVEILRNAGAVFYVKSNIPTAMMMAESVNNVFGRCVNPLNRRLTPGGSSGGESALIAFSASPLGVGTDIGGSLRIPAACTGIFTLKPSFGRSPILRCRAGLAGQEAVMSVNGPMAAHFESLELFMKAVVDSQPWLQDPKCLPIPWRHVEKKSTLKLGVIWDDGIVQPTPPVRRALKETVAKLRAKGFEIVGWDVSLHKDITQVIGRMFVADGGMHVRKMLEPTGEPFRPEMTQYQNSSELNTGAMWQLHIERTNLIKAYLDQWNSYEGLDGLLGPVTPFAAPENGKFGSHIGYTGVFNVLDYSATSFPTGVYADKELDRSAAKQPYGDLDAQIQSEYNPEITHGMPVSLQLVARRLEEEKVLMMTRSVLDAIEG